MGYINPEGLDWYRAQLEGGTYTLGPYSNFWWAETIADNGRWGYVSQVYFQGGGNYQRDACLWVQGEGIPMFECALARGTS